ncbi:hypothetical protein GOP47_0011864 [Adiantum capillus-veneris]|uniref:Pentatricopeptide repeat-containing protein n=1 Tax=Adiantum capillus-veneris TaxID=13818 RepID=A0A9D4UTP5_ADICA|nr:hypothetical protein GOP47_0011864 [Adiantum capillus-veneris]
MVVSILRLVFHLGKYQRIKTPFFCRSVKDISCQVYTESNAAEDDELDKQEVSFGKILSDINATINKTQGDGINDGFQNDNESEEFTSFFGAGTRFDLHDTGIGTFLGKEDGAFFSQHQVEVEQVECSLSSEILNRGDYPFDVSDGFSELVHAAADHIHQLDMAVNALIQLHTPQLTDTYFSILQACIKFKGLIQARRVHAHIISYGATVTSFLGDYLVMTLAKCGAVDDARRLYMTLPHPTVISCTALMSAYVECGQAQEALKMYCIMQEDDMEPDSYTFVSLLKAYEIIHDLNAGKLTHIHACKIGVTSIPHVCNSLIGMYGKCGALAEAENLFCLQCKSNIVSWTVMLSVYIEQGQAGKTLSMYRQMHEEGLSPDQFGYVFALQACSFIADQEWDLAMGGSSSSALISVEVVQALHADALRNRYAFDVFVGTALLTAYGKCGTLVQAEHMFDMLLERNLVTWNAMISAYTDKGQEEKALLLYTKMQKGGVKPEQMTFVIAFQACGYLAEKATLPNGSLTKAMLLQILQALHLDFCITEQRESMVASTALLRSYAKCGAILEAEDIFGAFSHPDSVLWNAMLTSYIEQAQGEKTICLYIRMQEEHMAVDDATMMNVLLGCSETVNVEVCRHVHFGIISTKFDQSLQVAATVIHAYGNCSMVIDAQACFDAIAEPDVASWNACIADHAGEGSFEAAFCMFENLKLAGMGADEIAFTSILTACMHTGFITVGLVSYESMVADFRLTPDVQHYSILIDLFARAGDFKRIANILEQVQGQGNMKTWFFLLGACRTHGNIELAKQVFGYALDLQPKQAIPYVLMSNIYATAGLQMDT